MTSKSSRIGATRLDRASTPNSLLADLPQIRWSWEDVRPHAWTELAAAVRIWLDYLRYFEPRYADAPRLRQRVGEYVPPLLRRITNWWPFRASVGRRALVAWLRAVERALPRQRELGCSDAEQPAGRRRGDAAARSRDRARSRCCAARGRCGARTALAIGSWDHLSSKGRISELPDRVLVWNDTQVREAAELHGSPAERLVVTGAQCYDQWFGRVPTRTREQFCSMLRLPADRPFLLYACSALYPVVPTEARFVRRWIEQIRASDDAVLRSAAMLVRPHPTRMEEWSEVDLTDLPNVTLYGSLPVDERSKEDYFESLYYCGAMIGLNTSAFIEAAIVGRPVHTIVVPEFAERQEGTLHFHYLKSVGGGVLSAGAELRRTSRAARRVVARAGRPRTGTPAFVARVRPPARSRRAGHGRLRATRSSISAARQRRLPLERRCRRRRCGCCSVRSRLPHTRPWRGLRTRTIERFSNCSERAAGTSYRRDATPSGSGEPGARGGAREKMRQAEAARADGAARRVVSGSRPPNARSAPERPSASVKSSSTAARSAVRPSWRRSSGGSAGSRPREDLLLDAASGHRSGCTSPRSASWRRAAIAFTWRSGAARRSAGAPALDTLLADHPAITWSWLSPSTSAFWSELAKTIRLWADYLRYFQPQYDAGAEAQGARRGARAAAAGAIQPPAGIPERPQPPPSALGRVAHARARTAAGSGNRAAAAGPAARSRARSRRSSTSAHRSSRCCARLSRSGCARPSASAAGITSRARRSSETCRIGSSSGTRRRSRRPCSFMACRPIASSSPAPSATTSGSDASRSAAREEFCRRVGLPADRPFILYVCSALFWGSPVGGGRSCERGYSGCAKARIPNCGRRPC